MKVLWQILNNQCVKNTFGHLFIDIRKGGVCISKLNVETLGQVFTSPETVKQMLALIKNNGRVLEPSCGNGAFSNNIKDCVAIEIDERVAPKYAQNMDFFDYPIEEKFDTIIGNPPYVRFQDIASSTKAKLEMEMFDERTNLYLFFIHKCIKHLNPKGELIFIVPRDFLKATSAIKLNNYIYENGTITDIIEMGDKQIFKDASPNTVIFRFEKDNFDRKTNKIETFSNINGQLLFMSNEYTVPFNELFFVKVGAVSGADKYFEHENGNAEFVCSKTKSTGKTRKMFYEVKTKELEEHKKELMSRKLKKFDETNWWLWGRKYYVSDLPRIYVNQKTRDQNPFFTHSCKAYDGSILAIFPKFKADNETIKQLIIDLNSVNWSELGFVCDGRFIFSQKSLENTILPQKFKKYINQSEGC